MNYLEQYYCNYDEEKALSEATRVTKPGGIIMTAYCMNESVVIQAEFVQKNLKSHLEQHMLSEDFHCISKPEDLFSMVRIEEIHALTERLPVIRLKTIAADGATNYMREVVDDMDDETFSYWMKYHFCTCERQDLIGATNHSLDILQKL